jgi:REP element-mobilizing transposase RayT
MIRLNSNPYDYRRKLPHYQKFDRPLFVTFCKRNREPLSPAARSLVLEHCLKGNNRTMHLHAVVIMPEHVHLLLTPMRNAEGWPFPLKDILKLVKGPAARSVNMLTGTHGALWQDESFDHVLRSNESFDEKLEYIRQNPVRRQLVAQPEEYEWLWVEES